jgi:DNA adenine methylase
MIKSPLRYPGGKSRAVKFLAQFIPKYREYREPFLGGGSVLFYALQKNPQAKYWANDLNYDLYCFWKMLKDFPVDVITEIRRIKQSENDGRNLFNRLVNKRQNEMNDLERAVEFFILNRITFSGVVDAGGYSKQAFHKRFTDSSIVRLEKIAPLLKAVRFTHGDYEPLLTAPGEDVFIFLDPPYYSATKSRLYGKNGCLHQQFDHERLAKSLANCPHKWLITYDNSDKIRDLYRDYHTLPWELQYGMNNYRQSGAAVGKELLIANFPLTAM